MLVNLQGKVAGVQITNNPGYLSQGTPKPSPTIIIANASTQSNEPFTLLMAFL
jgi:hypothetical protein